MKITAVLGSPNRDGNTARLVQKALDGARDRGAEVELIHLRDYRIEYCNGCLSNGSRTFCLAGGRCTIRDDAEMLKRKLEDSDGIILASPSYGIQPSARMKNFLTDRIGMWTAYTSGYAGKYFIGISTAGGIGASKVARDLAHTATVGFFGRAYASGSLGVLVGHGTVDRFPKQLDRAYRLGRKLARDITLRRRYPLQKLGDRVVNRLVVRRMILRNIRSHRDGRMKAVYANLTARGLITQ